MSFAEHLVDVATEAYTEKLFRFIENAIDTGTDQSFKNAEALILFIFSIHQAAKRAGDKDSRWLQEPFLKRLVEAFGKLNSHRKEAFDEALAAASEVTKQLLVELSERTTEGCNLRREALDAQRAIEDKFDQRY